MESQKKLMERLAAARRLLGMDSSHSYNHYECNFYPEHDYCEGCDDEEDDTDIVGWV